MKPHKKLLITLSLQIFVVICIVVQSLNAGLLRKPKIYNALITTDQNITPSRSFPIIQPHVHEPVLPYGAYPFAGGFYDPYINPLGVDYYNQYHLRNNIYPFGYVDNDDSVNKPENPKKANDKGGNNSSEDDVEQQNEGSGEENSTDESNTEANPSFKKNNKSEKPLNIPQDIPLNEFGLPPSLIPFGGGLNKRPTFLSSPYPIGYPSAPYPYPPYPYGAQPQNYYDQFGGYPINEDPYYPSELPLIGRSLKAPRFRDIQPNNNYENNGGDDKDLNVQVKDSPNLLNPSITNYNKKAKKVIKMVEEKSKFIPVFFRRNTIQHFK